MRKMEERMIYLTNPANLISLVIFIFWLGVSWSNLNWKDKELERRIEKIENLDLDNRLTRMEANLDWIRSAIEELRKK